MPKTITKPTGTDWERVKREAAQDAPIGHAATDGPYDPNDSAAVSAYWKAATISQDNSAYTLTPMTTSQPQPDTSNLPTNSPRISEQALPKAEVRLRCLTMLLREAEEEQATQKHLTPSPPSQNDSADTM